MSLLPALVSLTDFALRLGGISAADEDRAQAALDDASALIRAEAGDEDWVDADGDLEEVPDLIVAICVAVAIRAFRNPDGVRSESIGNYSVAYSETSTAVFLTDGERRLIRRTVAGTGLRSMELEGAYTVGPVTTAPVSNGGDPIPWVTIGDDHAWE